jgi:hypothetical protein
MAITRREHPAAPAPLAQLLSIDPTLLERPEAQQARQRGLLRAKHDALRAAEGLVGWARPLLIGVLIVSFLHLWHQIARIAPAGVPALPLPAWTHWLSAALLTISVDATALYLVATRSAAQYARLGGQGGLSVWFFYLLTAALNSLFVLSYTPGLPAAVQTITPALSLLGAILLGLLVPVSIAALERARQVADVARLSLLVEVETLRGIVVQGADTDHPEVRATMPTSPPEETAEVRQIAWAREELGPPERVARPGIATPTVNANPVAGNTSNAATIYRCRHCGAEGLTKGEQLEHGRRHARERQALTSN